MNYTSVKMIMDNMLQITMSATRKLWTMQTFDTYNLKSTTNLN